MNGLLAVPIDTLAFIISKARAFDALVEVDDPDEGSNPADDRAVAILEATSDNPVEEELTAALAGLNEEQLTELLALLWMGRGDYGRDSWSDALRQARAARNARVVQYLATTPMLGDLLEEGLAQLGVQVPMAQEDILAGD